MFLLLYVAFVLFVFKKKTGLRNHFPSSNLEKIRYFVPDITEKSEFVNIKNIFFEIFFFY